jgi:hypothetical protein
LELNEIDLIAATTAEIDKARRAALIDSESALTQERKDVVLQCSTEVSGSAHPV